MAYIPNNLIPLSSGNIKEKKIPLDFSSVVLSDENRVSDKDVCTQISNLCLTGEGVKVRYGQTALYTDSAFEGEFHSMTTEPFCEKLVLHIGTGLYCYSYSENEAVKIFDGMPDAKSIICEFLSKLYIYCDTHIFSLDSSFVLSEEIPDAPLVYDSIGLVSVYDGEKPDVPLNMLAPIIKVRYKSSTLQHCLFPVLCDTTRPFKAFWNDEEIDPSAITLTEDKLKLTGYGSESGQISVIYYVQNPDDINYKSDLYDCTLSIAYGGNANGGTRIFLTGNPGQKGRYYKSPLLNPLYFGEDEYEIIGDGCENVTCLKKMYGNLIVFTENSVYRMGYNLSDDGAVFSVKELNSSIGCDCPGSVQLIDNRVVFANSKKGIFIVDSTGESDEQNIKPISGNILKGNGCGFLDTDAQILKNAQSIDYDRKYVLFAGGRAYIWDYDRTPFSEYGNYSKSQNRLGWYIYDGVIGEKAYNLGGELVTFDTKNRYFYCFLKVQDSNMKSLFKTGRMSLSNVTMAKFVTELEFVASSSDGAQISITLLGDNEKYFKRSLEIPGGKRSHFKLILPKKLLYDLKVVFEATGGYELEGISVKYCNCN